MSEKKFTDQQLKNFQGNFLRLYQQSFTVNPGISADNFHQSIMRVMHEEVGSASGFYYDLDQDEKKKIYQACNALFKATPLYQNLSLNEKKQLFKKRTASNENTIDGSILTYNPMNTSIYLQDLSLLGRNLDNPNYSNEQQKLLSNIMHAQHSRSVLSDLRNPSLLLAWLGVDTLASFLAAYFGRYSLPDSIVPVLIWSLVLPIVAMGYTSLRYLFNQWANVIERLWHHESQLKDLVLPFSTLMIFAGIALFWFGPGPILLVLGLYSGSLLMLLSFTLSALSTGLVANAVSQYGLNALTNYFNDSEALDPADETRFALTEDDEKSLISKKIDPIAVKCAIVALRAEMSYQLGSEDPIPGYYARHSEGGESVQSLLDKVRALRKGEITIVQVGQLHFNCRIPNYYFAQQHTALFQNPQTPYEQYVERLQPLESETLTMVDEPTTELACNF